MKKKITLRILQKAIDDFCQDHDWAHPDWKRHPPTAALFKLRSRKHK